MVRPRYKDGLVASGQEPAGDNQPVANAATARLPVPRYLALPFPSNTPPSTTGHLPRPHRPERPSSDLPYLTYLTLAHLSVLSLTVAQAPELQGPWHASGQAGPKLRGRRKSPTLRDINLAIACMRTCPRAWCRRQASLVFSVYPRIEPRLGWSCRFPLNGQPLLFHYKPPDFPRQCFCPSMFASAANERHGPSPLLT